MDSFMAESAEATPVRPDGESRGHTARMALVVLGLAAGFAFVPRATQSCGKTSMANEDAPDWTATVVAGPVLYAGGDG